MLRNNWKLALSVGSLTMNAEALTALADAGIHEIELSSGKLAPFYEVLDYPAKAKDYSALAASCGVRISSIHLPFAPFSQIDPSTRNPEKRAFLLEKQTELIRAAGDAGIGIAVIHPSGEPYPEEERAERLACACGVLEQLTRVATESGMVLALENLPRTCLGRSSEEMLYFLDRIPELRACFDTNHSLSEDNVHFIRALGDRIVTLHVSDYDGVDEKHWLPGEGINNWSAMIGALEEVGYTGRFLYELGGKPEYRQIRANYDALLGLA